MDVREEGDERDVNDDWDDDEVEGDDADAEDDDADDEGVGWVIDYDYLATLKKTVLFQLIGFVFVSMILDFGQTQQYYMVAIFAFWVAVAVNLLRWPKEFSKTDFWVLRWGWVVVFLLTPYIMRLVWVWRGVRLP